VGTHWTASNLYDGTEYLDASAYDGVSAHRLDSLALSNAWPRPLLIAEGNIFIGQFDGKTEDGLIGPIYYYSGGPTLIETWRLSDAGKLVRLGAAKVEKPVSTLAAYGSLLAAQQTDNGVLLLDISDPAALRKVGAGGPGGCLSYDLSRGDGVSGRGLWLPLGAYGVARIEAAP
jgi:hypothetical protein